MRRCALLPVSIMDPQFTSTNLGKEIWQPYCSRRWAVYHHQYHFIQLAQAYFRHRPASGSQERTPLKAELEHTQATDWHINHDPPHTCTCALLEMSRATAWLSRQLIKARTSVIGWAENPCTCKLTQHKPADEAMVLNNMRCSVVHHGVPPACASQLPPLPPTAGRTSLARDEVITPALAGV
jgi:hypothetical protein